MPPLVETILQACSGSKLHLTSNLLWDIEKLGIVAFIQDMETKEVMQAIIQKIEEK